MDAIKLAVAQTLEKQGVISQLKAQLRAQVFLAIDEYEGTGSATGLASKTSNAARKQLLGHPDGELVIQLVLDLLDTCNFAFTKQVFEPELGPGAPRAARHVASSNLGLAASSSEEPLLLTLVQAFKSGGSGTGGDGRKVSGSGTPAAASAIPSSTASKAPAPSASAPAPSTSSTSSRSGIPGAPLPRLEPIGGPPKPQLAPLGRPPLAPSGPSADSPPPSPPAKPAAPAAAASAKPAKEASGADDYDEDFEEEVVEEEVAEEDDTLVSGGLGGDGDEDDEDDDYAAAMGYKGGSASSSPARPDLGAGRSTSGGGAGRTALDADLMAGDRSFGMSNELAGLDAGNSGGLSYSTDFPGAGGGAPDLRGSLSTSQAMLSPISEGGTSKPKLEPLKPVASKLSPLGPLPGIGTLSSSLSSSKDDPLGTKGPKPLAPLGAPGGRMGRGSLDIDKEREELRRLGLLSGDSLGTSMEAEPSRPRGGGPPTSIYDAEVSVSASMDEGGFMGGEGGRPDKMPFGASKGLSMDLRDTGLEASDRSGDMENMGGFDFAETAEWH